jgi:hypothetical protein
MIGARHFVGTDAAVARTFAERWLPAWSGDNPEHLLSFYEDDAHYADPAIPDGVHGKDALRSYFVRLLARNPEWEWVRLDATPMKGGFLNKWRATIPTERGVKVVCGVCTVAFGVTSLIARNEVYFDRSPLLLDGAVSKAAREMRNAVEGELSRAE